MRSNISRKQRLHRLTAAIFGRVEGPAFDVEGGTRGDAHRGENRGVQVADRDWVARYHEWALRGGIAVEEAALHAAAEHHDRDRAGEMAMQAVVDHLLHRVGRGTRLIAGVAT